MMKVSSTTARWWERQARETAPLPQNAKASSPALARSSSHGSGERRKAARNSTKRQKVCVFNCVWRDVNSPTSPTHLAFSTPQCMVQRAMIPFCYSKITFFLNMQLINEHHNDVCNVLPYIFVDMAELERRMSTRRTRQELIDQGVLKEAPDNGTGSLIHLIFAQQCPYPL